MILKNFHLFSSSRPQEPWARVFTSYSPQTPTPLPTLRMRSLLSGMLTFTQRRSTPFRVWGLSLLASGPITSSPFPRPDTVYSLPAGSLLSAPTSAPPAAETSFLPPRSTWEPGARFPGVTGGEGSGEPQVLSGPPFRTLRARRAFTGSQDGGAEGSGPPPPLRADLHYLRQGSVYNYCPPPRQRRQPGDRPRWRWRRAGQPLPHRRLRRCRTGGVRGGRRRPGTRTS